MISKFFPEAAFGRNGDFAFFFHLSTTSLILDLSDSETEDTKNYFDEIYIYAQESEMT